MSLTNPNTPVSQQDLQDFYHKLLPYMGGGSGGGGGHTIEDSEGTELTQRDTLQFGEGFIAEDDGTNEKTVISPDVMQSGDMDDVITPLPSVAPKKEGVVYSTTEQVIGEWIGAKPLYQKTFSTNFTLPVSSDDWVDTGIGATANNIDQIISCIGIRTGNYNGTCFFAQTIIMNDEVQVIGHGGQTISYITLQYTKTTDIPNT